MLRRNLLLGTTALSVTACAGKTVDQVVVTVAADASTIANGLTGVLAQLGPLASTYGISGATMALIGTAVAGLQSVATQVSGATTAASAQPMVQKIETYVNTIVSALAGLPLPPPISTALMAAAILLPVIESAVGLIINSASPGARLSAAAPTMTPDQARLILKGAAVKAGVVNISGTGGK